MPVLILVVVDNGLVQTNKWAAKFILLVLILVVVDNGIVHGTPVVSEVVMQDGSLNPCCSGQWYRTQPYKTLLIINKLKNFTKQIFTFLNRKLTIP